MHQIAGGTLECPDVKARGSASDTCQRHRWLAFRAAWSLNDGHETSPLNQAGARHSQSPVDCRSGTVMGIIMRFGFPCGWSMLTTFGNFALASTIAAGRNACGHWTSAQLEVDDATLLFRYRRHSTDSHDSCCRSPVPVAYLWPDIAQKNPCTERTGVSNAEKLGTTASNLAVWRQAVWSTRDSSANNASLGAGAVSFGSGLLP
jgi:hypothetical protein